MAAASQSILRPVRDARLPGSVTSVNGAAQSTTLQNAARLPLHASVYSAR